LPGARSLFLLGGGDYRVSLAERTDCFHNW
jgi:hypothetical protein